MVKEVIPGVKFEVSNVNDPSKSQTITFPHTNTKKTPEGDVPVDVDGISTWDLINVLRLRVRSYGGDSASAQVANCLDNVNAVETWMRRHEEKGNTVI